MLYRSSVKYLLAFIFILLVSYLFNSPAHAETYFLACPHDWELSVAGPLAPAACRHSDDGGMTYISDVQILTLPELSDLVHSQLVSSNYMLSEGDFGVILMACISLLFTAWAGKRVISLLR